ncbi:hypothetical protein BD324DRAFT_651314 [Kockovaella imperatae]|uniref:NudC domain-containing protein 1 n=1 Tax=Kockovaella imperatae TaxID=4999 RepID=A0A1Y1UFL3_9TREE|nr:hypothetical protein BD324DRAFT_651314 [Kockovaella imperatae]ORX36833.1 hypothetical protein BD324DRAFT_651314 [Kockovaella imperatae]
MDALFPPDRSLLFPQFETYRLQPLDPDEDVISFPLPGQGATQSRVGYNTHLLSFSEVKSRIEWNHLAAGQGRRGMYVDADWNVIGFQLEDDYQPTFSTIANIRPGPSSEPKRQPEYPSCIQLDNSYWAVADGAGALHLVKTSCAEEPFSGEIERSEGPKSSGVNSDGAESLDSEPFLIQGVRRDGDGKSLALLLSFAHPVGKAQKQLSSSTAFELVEWTIGHLGGSTANGHARLPSHFYGSDLPISVDWSGVQGSQSWTVLSSKQYTEPQAWDAQQSMEIEKKQRENLVDSRKPGLGAKRKRPSPPIFAEAESSQAAVAATTRREGAKIEEMDESAERAGNDDSPYSWTQTADAFTLHLDFPPGTSRQEITISLDDTSLDIVASSMADTDTPLFRFLRRRKRRWFGDIDAGGSTWTYEPKTGVLEFEVVKRDTNIRWPSLFVPSDDDDDDDDDETYDDIPETFDAATLAAVRESFGRIRERNSSEPEGNHPAIPALLREEMDYDLDDDEDFDGGGMMYAESGGGGGGGGHKIGRDVLVGTLTSVGEAKWSKASSTVVSLPMSGDLNDGIMIKSAVDGLLFCPPQSGDPSNRPWSHRTTSPALSFVLGSKRDVRFVKHVIQHSKDAIRTTVMAFDSGAVPGSGNAYIYYPPVDRMTAKQGVVKISGGERGALLGVGQIVVNGKIVVVALCEKELVVLRSVLRD